MEMGLFTKKIGPTFKKRGHRVEEYIQKLKVLNEEATGKIKEDIEKELMLQRAGLKGENEITYALEHSDMDMYILQDIYLEHISSDSKLTAQIDYIIITRKNIYIIECKNLSGSIEIANDGSFIRNFMGKRERIPSPVEQNKRHLGVINTVYEATQRNTIIKQLFENSLRERCRTLVVLANTETMLYAKYAKKEVKEQIVYVDLLVSRIRELDDQVKTVNDWKEMSKLVEFFLSVDKSEEVAYFGNRYEKLVAEVDEQKKIKTKSREQLIKELKAFRLEQSRLEKKKPYYIFNDAQMEDLIDKNPHSKEELLDVSGFGKIKVEQYGDFILKILQNS